MFKYLVTIVKTSYAHLSRDAKIVFLSPAHITYFVFSSLPHCLDSMEIYFTAKDKPWGSCVVVVFVVRDESLESWRGIFYIMQKKLTAAELLAYLAIKVSSDKTQNELL